MPTPKRSPQRPLTRDYFDTGLRALSRDLVQHVTRSIDASEKRMTVKLVRIEDRLILVETRVEALMTEEVLRQHLRKLAANLARELAAQGIRVDANKLVA